MGDFSLSGQLGDLTSKAISDLDDGLFYGTATVQNQPLDGQHLTQNSNCTTFLTFSILIDFKLSS